MFCRDMVLLLLVILVSTIEGSTKPTPARVPLRRIYHQRIETDNEGYYVLATTSSSNWSLQMGGRNGFVRLSPDTPKGSLFWYNYNIKWADEGDIPTVRINCHVLARPHLIYEIENGKPRLWLNISDGSDFKATWMTAKDGQLYVGSTGMGGNSNLVKVVSADGTVETRNWTDHYLALRQAANITPTGYLLHEAVQWSAVHKQWFVLPKEESYSEPHFPWAPQRGSNLMLKANENFTSVNYIRYGWQHNHFPGRYLTAFSFFSVHDERDRMIMALRTTQVGNEECADNYVYFFDFMGYQAHNETRMPGETVYHGLHFV